MAKIIREIKPNIIHTHQPKAHFYGLLASKKCEYPHKRIATFHGTRQQFGLRDHARRSKYLNNLMYMFVDQYTLNHADRIIAVSKNTARNLSRTIQKKEKIVLIHNGVKTGILPRKTGIKKKWGLSGKTVIGSIGRLSYEKGMDRLIKAMAPILKEDASIRLVIAGNGNEADDLLSMAMELKVQDSIVNISRVPIEEDIRGLFDIYVQPSRSEGMPLALLGAMEGGIPVVATRCGGVPEAVLHNETGILVPNSDRSTWITRAVRRLLDDREGGKKMGKAARKKIKKDFNLTDMISKTESLYQGILEQAPFSSV